MKIFCINLPAYTERRATQIAQAQKYNLDIEFIDGIDASTLSDGTLTTAANNWTRPIRRADIGCFYAHRRAWKRVAHETKSALIIEDDAIFSNKLDGILNLIANHYAKNEKTWNIIYDLEFIPQKCMFAQQPAWQNADHNCVAHQVFENNCGAGGYILSPKASAKLYQEEQNYALLDALLWSRNWSRIYKIEPAPIAQTHILKNPELDATKRISRNVHIKPASYLRARLKRARLNFANLNRAVRIPWVAKTRNVKIQIKDFTI